MANVKKFLNDKNMNVNNRPSLKNNLKAWYELKQSIYIKEGAPAGAKPLDLQQSEGQDFFKTGRGKTGFGKETQLGTGRVNVAGNASANSTKPAEYDIPGFVTKQSPMSEGFLKGNEGNSWYTQGLHTVTPAKYGDEMKNQMSSRASGLRQGGKTAKGTDRSGGY